MREVDIIGGTTFAFLAPIVFLAFRNIFKDFTALLENPSETSNNTLAYLFDEKDFANFKKEINNLLMNKWEKYFSTGVIFGVYFIGLIIVPWLTGDLQPLLSRMSANPMAAFQQIYWNIFWFIVYSVFLSIVWMLGIAVVALLKLNRQSRNLHITKYLSELRHVCVKGNEGLIKRKAEYFEPSFIRFKAGLTPLTDFSFSLSLKIAFVAIAATLPQIIFLLLSGTFFSNFSSYGVVAVVTWVGTGLIFFAATQYLGWTIWSKAKNDAAKLLGYICVKKTEQTMNLMSGESINRKIGNEDKFVGLLNASINDITIRSNHSAIIQILIANLIALLPVILELARILLS